MQVSAPLRPERIKPEAKLTRLAYSLRPSEARIEPLRAARDALTKGRVVYRLVLQYKLTVRMHLHACMHALHAAACNPILLHAPACMRACVRGEWFIPGACAQGAQCAASPSPHHTHQV